MGSLSNCYPGVFTTEVPYHDMKCVTYTCGLTKLMNFYEKKIFPHSDENNMEKFNGNVLKERNSWVGGSFEGLLEMSRDKSLYDKQISKIDSTKLYRKIETKAQKAKVRRRVRSEYDGEYDYDRRWEITPFQNRAKILSSLRIVKVHMDLSFSANVNSKTIDDYGAFIVCLIKLIEKSGFLVEVYVEASGTNFFNGISKGKERIYKQIIKIKKADEYLPIQNLLATFNCNFMRRVIFGGISACADYINKEVSETLGTPYKYGVCYEVKDNEIFIHSAPNQDQQHSIIEELIKVLDL